MGTCPECKGTGKLMLLTKAVPCGACDGVDRTPPEAGMSRDVDWLQARVLELEDELLAEQAEACGRE